MARSNWLPSIKGLRGIGEMIGMAVTHARLCSRFEPVLWERLSG
jgi:hypothetical protein